jgi:hypothetical protein
MADGHCAPASWSWSGCAPGTRPSKRHLHRRPAPPPAGPGRRAVGGGRRALRVRTSFSGEAVARRRATSSTSVLACLCGHPHWRLGSGGCSPHPRMVLRGDQCTAHTYPSIRFLLAMPCFVSLLVQPHHTRRGEDGNGMLPWGSSPEQTTCYANTVCALSDESTNLESWTTECQNKKKTKSQLPSMYTKTGSLMATQSLPAGPPSSYKILARSRKQIEGRHVLFHLQKISANLGCVFSPFPSEEETESIVQGQSFWQAGQEAKPQATPNRGFRLRRAHQRGQNCSGWLLAASPTIHPIP